MPDEPRSAVDLDPPPEPPEPPGEDACCGNGCDPCVWDFYALERERYLEAVRAWRGRHPGAG